MEVNDVQSQLNRTTVARVASPASEDQVSDLVREAGREGCAISIAGGRHSMGGQQFAEGSTLLDMRGMDRVLHLDTATGLIEVEGGIQWPALIDYLHEEQADTDAPWAIRQKQTGVDQVTIGGSLAANAHGRGLRFPPIVSDVESFVLVGADGEPKTCSRGENLELFSLAIGGYGLFGAITRVTLRLVPRTKVRRVVMIIPVRDLMERVAERLEQGFVFGDCQYSVDLAAPPGAHPGVFSCYEEVPQDTPVGEAQAQLSSEDWASLYRLVRQNKSLAFQTYSMYYLGTSGQVYWSDRHQLSSVFEGYTQVVDAQSGTEMITEVYVRREDLEAFLTAAKADCVEHEVDITFGTIRLIEPDEDTFLPWATQPWACIVCNLHVLHTDEGIRKATGNFQRIIDRVIEFGGRYFLTYHRWARRDQVETCYPEFVEFLKLKERYDPEGRFQSDWYRHHREMFADRL